MQLTEKEKYKIVILREENYEINEIAEKMGINRNTVMKWINYYKKNNNVDRKKGSGGIKLTSSDDDELIINIIKKDNDLSIIGIKNILEEKDIKISKPTIYRRLIDNNFSCKFPIKKPFLSNDHKKKRLEWAIKHVDTDWNNIIFSDESTIRLSGFNKKKWIHNDDIVMERTLKYPLKKTSGDVFFKIKLDLFIFLRKI